jgi:Concanavalin A-like lectin/glucanases superfamily/Secretion system C-terminal sorting domain
MYTYTYDGTTLRHYINGVLKSAVSRNILTVAGAAGNRLSIGRNVNDSSARMSNFLLDELSVYNVALSNTQITALFNNQSLPTISNVAVSSLIHEGATISYTVNANGSNTNTFVLYGKTSAASELVATGTSATGTTNTACTATTQYNSTPSAAPPGTTMYYKVRASNSVGEIDSPVYTYTQVAKPTYQVNAVSDVTMNQATVNFNLNTNGSDTGVNIRFGTTSGNYPSAAYAGITVASFTNTFQSFQLSGLMPNTTYYYVVSGVNNYGSSQSLEASFTTKAGITAPSVTTQPNSNITTTSATINYSVNANGANTTTLLGYRPGNTGNYIIINGPSVSGDTFTPIALDLTGLLSGTTYEAYIQAINSAGTTTIGSGITFTTLGAAPIPAPVYNFEFNNSLQSQDGSVVLGPFVGGSTAFVSNGTVANGALQVNDARCQNSLPNLPLGISNRSVHIRLRFASGTLSQDNFVFNWGTGSTGQAFAYHQSASNTKLLGWGGSGYDYNLAGGVSFGQWYEYVFTYNGTTLSIYRDGNLLGSTAATLNTTGDIFRIGVSNAGIQKLQADIDYIRIFNQALNGAQVSQIFNNPNLLLSNANFQTNNLKFSLYPNPATNILNIESEIAIKSVEIYSLLGQKVHSSTEKQIIIAQLSKGAYMVRVEDIEGKVATKKLIKE